MSISNFKANLILKQLINFVLMFVMPQAIEYQLYHTRHKHVLIFSYFVIATKPLDYFGKLLTW